MELIAELGVKSSRRKHHCVWCVEPIEKLTPYKRYVYRFDGDFHCDKYHPECFEAMHKFFAENHEYADEGFDAHSFRRGTTEER